MSFDTSRIDWNAVNRVGDGGFGIVVPYKDPVNDPKGDKWVVKYAEAFDPRKIMMTIQEIVVGSKCNHPNILPLKSCFIDVDERGKWHIYIKLPRMKTSLEKYQDLERKNKPFTQEEIIKYFFGIVSGLEQLHLQKIAHRDIKPANVLLDDEGQVKLADFGVVVDMDGKTSMMISNQAGTRTYMAPEVELQMQLKYKELFKADMWSVGVTMAKLCLGAKFKPVEKGEYPLAQKEAFINKNLTELEGVYDSVLLDLIKSLVIQDPDSRKTIKDVREILQAEYAHVLGVEKIEVTRFLKKKEELSVDETPKPQSAEVKKSGDDIPLVKQISEPTSEKKNKKAQLEKIEEKSGESGSMEFTKAKPEPIQEVQMGKQFVRQQSEKKEEKQVQNSEEIQAEEGVHLMKRLSRQQSKNKEEKEAQQVNLRAENEEPKSSEKMVPQRLLNKDSQASESVEEKKIDEPKKNKRPKQSNINEKAELDELKELKKHMESSLKQEFTFKAAKNPVRFIIESKDPDKINDNVITKLSNQLKGYDRETFKNLQGISVTLSYCNENLNRGIRQLITDICVNCQNLTFLVFSFWGSTKNVNDLLLKHISSEVSTKLSNLEYLGLFFDECDQITEQGVGWISNGLVSKLPELKTLKLNFNACNQISNGSINELCQKIGQYLPGLETLELYLQECVELEDDTIKGIGGHFKSLKHLNHLILSLTNCTSISSTALLDLSKKIGQNLTGLTSLHLAVCGLNMSTDNQDKIRAELKGIPEFTLDT